MVHDDFLKIAGGAPFDLTVTDRSGGNVACSHHKYLPQDRDFSLQRTLIHPSPPNTWHPKYNPLSANQSNSHDKSWWGRSLFHTTDPLEMIFPHFFSPPRDSILASISRPRSTALFRYVFDTRCRTRNSKRSTMARRAESKSPVAS